MAKNFCENCGKKIEECTCKKDNKIEESKLVSDVKDIVKNIFKEPITTMGRYDTKAKFNLGLLLIVVNSIIFGICGYVIIKDILSSFMYPFNVSNSIEFKVCLLLIFLMLSYHFLFGCLLHYIPTTVLKVESDIKKTYSLIGVNSVISSVCLSLSLIGILVNYTIGLIMLVATFILYLLSIYHGFCKLSKLDEEKVLYVFVSSFMLSILVSFYILPKILL